MKKYFKNIQSLEDLKNQFKTLARKNHPGAGGNAETMKEINCEYDALFPIWKDRHNSAEPQNQTTETADSTRSQFYTDFGWEGENHKWGRDVADVAKIVRAYVKEKYPTWKFSVRISRYSMGRSLSVDLLECPLQMYKLFAEVYDDYSDYNKVFNKLYSNWLIPRDEGHEKHGWSREEVETAYNTAVEKNGFYGIRSEAFATVINDVDSFVNSYNFEDCDSMTDYYHVDFHFMGVRTDDCKYVPKTTRIKNQDTAPAKAKKAAKPAPAAPQEIAEKAGYTYKITKGEDTRDGSELWLVRIMETLDRAAYIDENKAMQERGGYYSKFRKAFIFRFDPTEILTEQKAA